MKARMIELVVPGLEEIEDVEIYLIGPQTNWDASPSWMYRKREGLGTYTLAATMEEGMPFKHFVVSKMGDRQRVASALAAASYRVTGIGDPSPGESDKWRTWFLLRSADGFEVEGSGVFVGNVWS